MSRSPLIFSGRIEAGKLVLDRELFAASLKGLPDGPVTVKIQTATRSQQANRFYWGVVLTSISDHTGYTPEELHALCKQRFNARTASDVDGDGIVCDREGWGSTAALDTPEFTAYVDKVRQWAAEEFGLVIPDPVSTPAPVPGPD